MSEQLYCNICNETTEHQLRGVQQGIPGKSLDLYDCTECKDTCGRWEDQLYFDIPDNSRLAGQFRENHTHLFHWLNTGLGRKYLEKQLNRCA